MTKIKLCGLSRICDIDYANELMPDYIGFVFAPKSKRYITFDKAGFLREKLNKNIRSVGVFTNAKTEDIEYLIKRGIIDIAQLHGSENNEYINALRHRVHCIIIQAFQIKTTQDIEKAEQSEADYIMLDSGGGTGTVFNHSLISCLKRDFFLAGGLNSENVYDAILKYKPYAVDASSSLETNGVKDKNKMEAFVKAVRHGKDDAK